MPGFLRGPGIATKSAVPAAPRARRSALIASTEPPLQHVIGTGSTAQASQSTQGAGRVVYHAAGVTMQGSQSTQAAGREVFHAIGSTSQSAQSTVAAGRIEYHAGAATVQGAQSTTGAGRLIYHSAAITVQAVQLTQGAGRLAYHSNGSTAQAAQSTSAFGRVVYHAAGITVQPTQATQGHGLILPPIQHILGGAVTSQAAQLTAAVGRLVFVASAGTIQASQSTQGFGTVANPVVVSPGGNVGLRFFSGGELPPAPFRYRGKTRQKRQVTQGAARVVTRMSENHEVYTEIHVFERRSGGPASVPDDIAKPSSKGDAVPVPRGCQFRESSNDDELAAVFALAA